MTKTRILYIDANDPSENDWVHQETLERETDFYYDIFHTSSEAIASLDSRIYSGLFVGNLNVPYREGDMRSEKNGKEVVRAAKKRNLKTLVLLNESSPEIIKELAELGVEVLIENPIANISNYLRTARELFGGKLEITA